MRSLLLIENGTKESELALLILDKGVVDVPKRHFTLVSLLPRLHKGIVQVKEHFYEFIGLFC